MFAFYCRAAEWKLDQPDWVGRLRICVKGKQCFIKLEDKSSGLFFISPSQLKLNKGLNNV